MRGGWLAETADAGNYLGAQIAGAAGNWVYPADRRGIGWYPIQFTPEAAADPALSQLLDGPDPFSHWHGDTFDLPPGARLIERMLP